MGTASGLPVLALDSEIPMKRPLRLAAQFLIVSLSLGLAAGASATVIGTFTGTVTLVGPGLEAEFSVGDTFSGSFAYDETQGPDQGNLDSLEVTFTSGYAAAGCCLQLVFIYNDHYRPNAVPDGDSIFLASNGVVGPNVAGPLFPFGGFVPQFMEVGLADSTATAFSSSAFPTRLDLTDFDSSGFQLFFDDGNHNPGVFGVLTSLSTVPEAGTATIGAVALIAFARRRRWRS